jgi:hypothetical protein
MTKPTQLVYEFESVRSIDGKSDVRVTGIHTNPVFILKAIEGQGAIFGYPDKPNSNLETSKVEKVFIFNNSVNIKTQNTDYWLVPHIKEVY